MKVDGAALVAERVELPVLVDIGDEGKRRILWVAVFQQRMRLEPAEALAEARQFLGAETLAVKDENRVAPERLTDERNFVGRERSRELHARDLAREPFAQGSHR